MKNFITEDFLLENKYSQELYHNYSKVLPIIDYHSHLSPKDIANDRVFKNLTECWLDGDHYKWRALRANAIEEKYITGHASDEDRFLKWAETVPYTMCNPLYHWTHLELKRYFGINTLLNQNSGKKIYNNVNELLQQKEYSVQNLVKKMNVEVICTTDEPTDTLEYHKRFSEVGEGFKMFPTFRPDKFIAINTDGFVAQVHKLEEVTNSDISTFKNLLEALEDRIEYFDGLGCRLSDHGLAQLYAIDYNDAEIETIFSKGLSKKTVTEEEAKKYQMALLYHLAKLYNSKGWTMQLHLGPLRDNNKRLKELVGNDVGCDSIGDYRQAEGLSHFLNKLDYESSLPKTILYNLNPNFNEVLATMAGNFNDSSCPAKVQFGTAWWFMDQKEGMEKQLKDLSNIGLISRFVGMLTDSRSFLSFPRHEYFRRILCNQIGTQIYKGELPNDMEWIGKMVADISYYNAKGYFGFHN